MRIPIFRNVVLGGVFGGDLHHLRHKKGHRGHKISINQDALHSGSGLGDLEKKFTGLLRKKTNLGKFKL
jgi:hypothetical protein